MFNAGEDKVTTICLFLVKGGDRIFLRKKSKVLGKAGKERFSASGNEHYVKFVRCVIFNSSS